MLWLIWVAVILLTPVAAGVGVWWQVRGAAAELPAQEPGGDAQQ